MSDVEIVTFGCRLNAYESEAIRARVVREGIDELRRRLLYRHDVVDDHARRTGQEIGAVTFRRQFLLIAEHVIHFPHRSIGLRLGLSRTAGHDDPRIGVFAAQLADGLTRLPHRLGGHRASVDDDGIG